MISKIRHYFLRRKALKLFADKFLFEPLPPPVMVAPAAQPATTFAPPFDPNPAAAPTEPIPPPPASVPQPNMAPSPKEEIVNTLNPMIDNRAKMEVINRRVQ